MENFRKIKLGQSVLVLNSDFNPINIANARKAIKLVLKQKAEFISEKVIRLINFIYLPVSKMRNTQPSRRAIHLRDGNKCVYCNKNKNLTIDHIIPTSRGGDNSWSNMVCCCNKCNTYKGNKTPAEAGMKFINLTPRVPFNRVIFNIENSKETEWMKYVYA
jgi:hypothetical protein